VGIVKELGYSCSRGSNHVDLYGVHDGACGSKANGRVYIEFDSNVSEQEAQRIVDGFVEDQCYLREYTERYIDLQYVED